MGVKIQVFCDKTNLTDNRVGILLGNGLYSGRSSPLWINSNRRASVAMFVLCHIPEGQIDCRQELLSMFQDWFGDNPNLCPDIVLNWWRYMIRSLTEAVPDTLDLAVVLVYGNRYMYITSGSIYTYEFFLSEKKIQKWPTCSERNKLDFDLGVTNQSEQDYYFKTRVLCKSSKIIISADVLPLINPNLKEIRKIIKTGAIIG